LSHRIVVLAGTLVAAACVAAFAEDTNPPAQKLDFQVVPDRWERGKSFDVTVSDTGCPTTPGRFNNQSQIVISSGFGVAPDPTATTSNVTSPDGCYKVMRVIVDPAAQVGDLVIRIEKTKDSKGTYTATCTVTVKVIDVVPGPVPPGLSPQVDVTWSVIPAKIMQDNFGGQASRKYYGIDIVIGNNSGYDLLIAGVAFHTLSTTKLPEQTFTLRLPNTGYRTARGTLEKAQQVGWRAMTLNIVRALGPVGTGFIPFFKVTGHRTTYTTALDVFSSPFEKGIELVMPDTLIRELDRLDDQLLHDNQVIHNNDQVRTRVFMPRDVVRDLMTRLEPTSQLTPGVKLDPKNTVDVTAVLHELVLAGTLIPTYLPRVHLTSFGAGTLQPPPNVLSESLGILPPGTSGAKITIAGSNLQNAQVAADYSKIHISSVTIDSAGKTLSASVGIDADAAEGWYRVTLKTPSGSVPMTLHVEKQAQSETAPSAPAQSPAKPPASPPKKAKSGKTERK